MVHKKVESFAEVIRITYFKMGEGFLVGRFFRFFSFCFPVPVAHFLNGARHILKH
jgi:hypothetical protein